MERRERIKVVKLLHPDQMPDLIKAVVESHPELKARCLEACQIFNGHFSSRKIIEIP
jgi:hypothetical protein